jgi:hypothetical protein
LALQPSEGFLSRQAVLKARRFAKRASVYEGSYKLALLGFILLSGMAVKEQVRFAQIFDCKPGLGTPCAVFFSYGNVPLLLVRLFFAPLSRFVTRRRPSATRSRTITDAPPLRD